MAASQRGATVTRTDGEAVSLIRVGGILNEGFDAAFLAAEKGPVLVLDLEGVQSITSFGVRQWTGAMRALPATVERLVLVRCPPCFVYQLNSVVNFGGRAEVVTAAILAFCDACGEEWSVMQDVLRDRARLLGGAIAPPPCPSCGQPAAFEDDLPRHFRFAEHHGARTLDPRAAAILEREGLYRHEATPTAPRGEKLVHGDVTLLRLSGALDGRFRSRNLTAGVEGDVVLDVGAVESVDPARWTGLLEELAGASSLVLVDVPESLLALPLGRAAVASLRLDAACPRCRRVTTLTVPLPADASVTGVCSSCGADSIRRLPVLPKGVRPAVLAPETQIVVERREELLSRAQAESGAGGFGLERYKVIRPLGKGGMAEVVLAVRQGIGGFAKLIALKKVRRELTERRWIAVDRFLDEAKIAANLNHPSIAQVFEVGEKDGELYIAMEYVHGVDALRLLREGRERGLALGVEQVLFIGARVAAALHHAHGARDLAGQPLSIVHCDVSPSNIVIGYDGQVKLVDFGIARAAVVRSDGAAWGKFSYMSPEQLRGEGLDGRSDVFSLGIVLHELLSGRALFGGKGRIAVIHEPIPPLGPLGVPRFVEDIVLGALNRSLIERTPDARTLQVALERAAQRLGSTYDEHQLASYMRKLFGDEQVAAPIVGELTPRPR